MIKKLSALSNRPFIRNVATVATGAVAAQAITVAFSPIITRLYGPEAFGVLGVFLSITTILVSAASLTYHVSIVLPVEDRDAKGLISLSLVIAACVTLIVTAALLFFKNPIVELLQIQAIASFVLLVPIFVFFTACNQILRQWMIRKKQYKSTAAIEVASAFSLNGLKTGAGFFWPSSVTLVCISTFGSLLNMLMLIAGAKKTLFAESSGNAQAVCASWRNLISLAKRHRDFPLFRAPTVLLSSAAQGLPVMLLAGLFGPAAAGFYALGRRVISLPGQIIGKAIGDVFYPRIARAANTGENIRSLILRATLGKAAVAVVPYALIIMFGPMLFGFVFGREWVTAGEYARWLAVWNLCMFISQPCVLAVPVLAMQGIFLIFQTVYDICRISSLYIGYVLFKNDVATVSLFCIIGALFHIFIVVFVLHKASGWHAKSPPCTKSIQ